MDRIPQGVVERADRAVPDTLRATSQSAGAGRAWALQLGLLCSLIFWIIAWHWETAASMAQVWWRSETFAHGMVVYPISLWLIWRKRASLQQLAPASSLWVAVPLAAAGFAWLVGDLGGVQAASQFSLVAMIVLTTWLMLGTRIAYAIAFPLSFTFLAVPVGDFLLPILIEHTADFTVAALRLSGIPVYREGNNFVIPSGTWSVVETCSGLRYLIASIMLGTLYAYLTYRSPLRRVFFVGLSIVVPIVANWLRAYMIVMIGHLSSMKLAVGVDHLIYGWIFFGFVMLIMFWIGSFWREDIGGDGSVLLPAQPGSQHRPLIAASFVAVIAAAAPSYSTYLRDSPVGPEVRLATPSGHNGWQAIDAAAEFRPHFFGARASIERIYEREGTRVGVFIGYYARERDGSEMISFNNTIVPSRDRSWIQRDQRLVSAGPGLDTVQTQLRSPAMELTVWHWYWAGSRWTADPRVVKFRQAMEALLQRGDDAAIVVLYARAERKSEESTRVLRAFAEDMSTPFAASLEQARRARAEIESAQTASRP